MLCRYFSASYIFSLCPYLSLPYYRLFKPRTNLSSDTCTHTFDTPRHISGVRHHLVPWYEYPRTSTSGLPVSALSPVWSHKIAQSTWSRTSEASKTVEALVVRPGHESLRTNLDYDASRDRGHERKPGTDPLEILSFKSFGLRGPSWAKNSMAVPNHDGCSTFFDAYVGVKQVSLTDLSQDLYKSV